MAKKPESVLWAFLIMFLPVLGIGITALAGKHKDKYAAHYMKQSLNATIILGSISMVLVVIPIIGWLIGMVVAVAAVVYWFIGWIYALGGDMRELPLIGEYATELFSGF